MDRPDTLTRQLRTARLTLQPLREEDEAVLTLIAADSRVRDRLWDLQPRHHGIFTDLRLASDASFSSHGCGLWSLVEEGRCIGVCGLQVTQGIPRPELVYLLAPERWGKGLAFEAALTVLTHAFMTLGLDYVHGLSYPHNERSLSLLRRLGMIETGYEHTQTGVLVSHSLSSSLFQFQNGDILRAGTA